MIFLIIFALFLTTATAAYLPDSELKSNNIYLLAGRPEGRITNGQIAVEGQFPYQVQLLFQNSTGNFSWCGGSILSHTKVLTAAHCTDSFVKGWMFLGSIRWETAEIKYNLTRRDILIHRDWINATVLVNDISIITIPYTRYSNNIQPVKLPSSRRHYPSYKGKEVIITGWGYTTDCSTEPAPNLRYANRTVISNKVCSSYKDYPVKPTNICIDTSDYIATCHGDSGGPMVLASNKVQIGIASFVYYRGCEKGVPAVYTRVTKYLKWIKKNAGI